MKNVFLTITTSMINKINNIQVIDLNEMKIYCGSSRIGDSYDDNTHTLEDIIFYYPYNFEILNENDLNHFLNIDFEKYKGKSINHFFRDYDLSEYKI